MSNAGSQGVASVRTSRLRDAFVEAQLCDVRYELVENCFLLLNLRPAMILSFVDALVHQPPCT